jgi:ACS family tartrate transporter-like MFS transporter
LLSCIFTYAFSAPIILRGATGFSIASVGVLMAINGLLGAISLTMNATHSDRAAERRWHLIIPLLLGAAAFLVAAGTKSPWWVVPAFAVAITSQYATHGIFFALPGSFLRGKTAAAGIALITAMSMLGGFAGPAWAGWMKDLTGSYGPALITLASLNLTGAAIVNFLGQRTS